MAFRGLVFFSFLSSLRAHQLTKAVAARLWHPLFTDVAESEEELKSLLMNVKEESEKTGLKFNIQRTKIMASSLITSWQIDGETMETVADFIFWGSKSLQMVTAAMKLKDACFLGKKAMTNLAY